MSQNPRDFPNVADKLSAPSKKSVFERQKAEAEAKRLKEQQETAAVYADFVRSFDDEQDDDDGIAVGGVFAAGRGRSTGPSGRHQTPVGPGKRHFTANTGGPGGKAGFGAAPRLSGPGSLGPPAPSLSRKRAYDGGPASGRGFRQDHFGFDAEDRPQRQLYDSDDEDSKEARAKEAEKAASRPTLHLSSLPPLLSPSAVKALFPSSITIESVRKVPTPSAGPADRKSASAIVTLATETPASEIDSTVSALQNRYLGWGFYIKLSRHLSSTALGSTLSLSGPGSAAQLPFGAKAAIQGPHLSLSRAPPPPGMGRGFAPPASYGPTPGMGRGGPPAQVEVTPPSDLKQLKLIHKTVESVISHGAEFEALLMSRPSVQKDEKWAWLWDSRSKGGVWYRWRLWDVLTSAQQRIRRGKGRNDNATQIVFLGSEPWASQERALAFEYDSKIAEFVSDSEYDSSDEEDSGDEGRRRLQHLQGGPTPGDQVEPELPRYLNPLQKAKLVHLLARLPTSTSRLRRGDIARITAFAIKYANQGADEAVDLITLNVHTPFNVSSANPDHKRGSNDPSADERPENEQILDRERDKDIDISSVKLVGLYVISDILSSSSTSGVRHAWRFRQLFETTLRKRDTFAYLGRLEKELGWGRLRSEKFKRSVNTLLALWEGWCVFPALAHEEFAQAFNEPPLTELEKIEAARKEKEEEKARKTANSKWRTVDEGEKGSEQHAIADADVAMDDLDGEPMLDDDEDVDGVPMEEDDDLDGKPMAEDEPDVAPSAGTAGETNPRPSDVLANSAPEPARENKEHTAEAVRLGRRRRPKAEDMFADSDGE